MRILLADDQTQVRTALQTLLKHQVDMQVVGEASEAHTLLNQIEQTKPDLVLLDWNLPDLSAIGSVSRLRRHHPQLLIVVLSGRPEMRRQALAAKADAFVSKIDQPEHLLAVLYSMQTRLKQANGSSPELDE